MSEFFYPHMAGCERRFLEIGKRLSERGHDVHVFTVAYRRNLPKEENVHGIHVHRIYSNNYITSTGSRSLSGVLKYSAMTATKLIFSDFDVYYFNQWPILHSMFTKPFVSPLIQEWCEVWIRDWRIIALQKAMTKIAHHHVSVSNFTKRRLIKLGVQEERITVIPNGVSYDKLSQGSHKKKWGRIIYVGRLTPHKHVEMLIDAFSKVVAKIRETELHIVGSGPLLPEIERQASKINQCYVHGFLSEEEMLRLLKSSWLFVLPSEREGSGIAALEAMATGIPVVTTNSPSNATKELVSYGNGMVVEPTSQHIASAIRELFSGKRDWEEMSRNARSFAATFDWDKVADDMERLLDESS